MFNSLFTKRSLSLTSLRVQLLLWVSLPAAVLLLAVSLNGVRGHEKAMQRLVQERADSLAQASAALIRLRLDRTQDSLHQLAGKLTVQIVDFGMPKPTIIDQASSLPAFSAGLALYNQSGEVIASNPRRSWQDYVEVRSFVEQILISNADVTLTIYERELNEWLLLQGIAVPVQSDTTALVLIGAIPLTSLELSNLIQPLSLSPTAEIHIEDMSSNILIDLAGDHSDSAFSSHTKVAIAQSMIESLNLRIVLRESWADLVPPVLRFENAIFAIIGMTTLVSLLSVFLGLRGIVQPLQRLDWAANQVGWGHFDALEQSVGGVQEIEDLRLALKQMAGQIRQYQQELQSYISAMMLGQEEERKRLARELHDETVQALIAVKQQVEIAESRLSKDPAGAAQRLNDLQPLLSDTITGIRRQIHDLRPLYIEDLGFVAAVEMLVKQTTERHNLVGDFEVGGQQRRLPAAAEISAYRIVQEALNNVIAHAGANWVHVVMAFDTEGVTVTIEDDGCGFNVPTHTHNLASQGHYGLLGIRERAKLCGGHVSITSAIGHGTSVITWLPVPVDSNV
jgi:signal transduction histidine kinase